MLPLIVDLTSYYGLINVSGPEAATFLQGQLTCDIQEINDTELRLGAFCNLKGRIRALFRIFKKNDSFYLQLPKPLLNPIITQLKKYGMFSKVSITDASALWDIIGISGTQDNLPPVSIIDIFNFSHFFNLNNALIIDSSLLTIQSSDSRLELMIPTSPSSTLSNRDAIWQHLSDKARITDFNHWKLLEIRSGYPEVWLETSEQFLPHHLNLPGLGAISFNKGCYCGQEIIARMHYLGKIKRKMITVRVEKHPSILLPGAQFPGENAEGSGTVITAATSDKDAIELLIEVQLPAAATLL
jgi:folate-binding protein YgfZ